MKRNFFFAEFFFQKFFEIFQAKSFQKRIKVFERILMGFKPLFAAPSYFGLFWGGKAFSKPF